MRTKMGARKDTVSLVTGAAGFIGSHLIQLLLERGHEVRCLVLDGDDSKWIKEKDVQIFYGDCTEKKSIVPVVTGEIDYIFHLAAVLKTNDHSAYDRVNFEGTKNVLDLCLEKNVALKRFVYISSITATGPGSKTAPLKESDICNPINEYGRSKIKTENFLRRNADKISHTIVRPTLVYGPRDLKATYPYYRIISRGVKPLLGHGLTNVIYVKDLVRFLLVAAESEESVNQSYFVGEEKVYSYREIADTIEKVMGKKAIPMYIPQPLIFASGAFFEFLAKITKTVPLFDLRRARDLSYRYWNCDVSKMKNELGFTPQYHLEKGVRETTEWYRNEGLIR
jgi:dihydroflavonol-4-reductase